ncbi:MAG TPA: glutamate--tRNA ligase, partial [Kofleriaceae bacterium]|nr:glutamate--tRNA ligase [Kofleriaceae bacterium]
DEGPFTQMERLPLYRAHAERLIAEGKAYRCYCTKAELDAQRAAAPQGFKYPGTCRDRADEPDLAYVVRLKTDRAGAITYVDQVFGEIVTANIELQDFVLVRSDGVPLYNFGAVVDDMTMRVSLVARGRDHMINTPPQILLYQAFGATVPAFAHLPMMLAASGEKLSKRHGAVSVTEYRDAGYSPDAVLDYLARFGWSTGEHEVRLSRSELVAAFDWAQCGRGDGKFDAKKFLAIDHEHLKSPHLTSDDVYLARVRPFIAARGLVARDDELRRALPAIRERAQTFVQAADLLDPLLRELPVVDPAAARKFLVAETAPVLRELADVLARVEPWTVATLEAAVTTWLRETGREMKTVGQPARVALTGRTASPSLYDVLALIGRDRARARLAAAAELSG